VTNVKNTKSLLARLALAAAPLLAMPHAAAMPADDLQVSSYAKLNGWEVRQFKMNGIVETCDAVIITGEEQALRFEYNAMSTSFGFMAPGSAASTDPISVTIALEAKGAEAQTMDLPLAYDPEGTEWRSYVASNEEPDGMFDLFANAASVSFTYATPNGDHTQTFALKGANAVTAKTIECVNSAQ
jgi:hypothetical protein